MTLFRAPRPLLLVTAAALLANTALAAEKPIRPQHAQQTADLSPTQLAEHLAQFEEGRWILQHGGNLRCGVKVFHYEYLTKGGAGEPATASSALIIPNGTDPQCTAPKPIVVALHGTVWDRNYNLGDLANRSNPASNRGLSWAGTFAAQGYIVIAPNYVGFDSSSANYHPYLDYRQQTGDVVDAISAGKRLLRAQGVRSSGKLFLTGFSQGGWLAMAVHRRLEATGVQLTASMPAAGSYLAGTLVDDIFLGRPVQGSTGFFPMALGAARKAGVKVYRRADEFFNPRYAAGIEQILPTPGGFAAVAATGKIPPAALFDEAVPDLGPQASTQLKTLLQRAGPEFAPEHLKPTYRLGAGPNALVKQTARLAYLQDVADHPDGAWPIWTDGKPPHSPQHPLRKWYAANDLRGWVPRAPITMCGGTNDPVVPLHLAGALMLRYWSSPGTQAPAGRVSLLNFDDPQMPQDRYIGWRQKMVEYRNQIAASAGPSAVVDAYHTQILPRFCYFAARDWFDSMR